MDMPMPPYSRRSHAHALAITGLLMGLPKSRTDREIREDTGLDPDKIWAQIHDGDVDENALTFLAIFDSHHDNVLTRLGSATVASGILDSR